MQIDEQATEPDRKVHPGNALGVFFVALATLMLEITLTRILSVTMWYHFGPLAVSLAMFGIGASGVLIYVLPGWFKQAAMGRQLSIISTLFGVSVVVCFYAQLQINFVPDVTFSSIATLTLIYFVTAIPFFLSGLCISLIFTHRPAQIGKLYFMDLVGAGLGCILAVLTMSVLSAPNVILLSAVSAGIGGLCFATAAAAGGPVKRIAVVCLALVAVLFYNVQQNLFNFKFVKGVPYDRPEYEAWNSYSYIGVWGFRDEDRPFGWGLSSTWQGLSPRERILRIDAGCATVITENHGDLSGVEHLKYDVTSIGHYLFDDHKVLIIGAGGGRDILAALSFGAREVHALEYNTSIIEVVSGPFGEFSGHPYDRPKVRKINAEGRSYVQRSDEIYDMIQISLVDSWAANASGAYIMAENYLYTKEAFAAYFDDLADNGVLTVTRYNLSQTPQLLRVVSIATAVLKDNGFSEPKNHLVVVVKPPCGTVLMSKQPFTPAQVRILAGEAHRLQFQLPWAPGRTPLYPIGTYITAKVPERWAKRFVYDISPPTDDNPFFFHMAKSPKALRHTLKMVGKGQVKKWNIKWFGPFVLIAVLVVATTLAFLCILVPLYFKRADLRGVTGKGAALGYFACLGIGFMLIEIPLMQRFTFFLGHPVFALSVVLFSLLVFAGCGSLLASRLQRRSAKSYLTVSLLLLIVLLGVYNFLLPDFMSRFIVLDIRARVALAVAALLPVGLLLGMPLPLGMRAMADRVPRLIPWLWGVNGACSVFASLFAIVLAMTLGFTSTMLIGTGIYGVALVLIRSSSPPAAAR